MMKKFVPVILLCLVWATSQASPGDTVRVTPHNNTHLAWYGNYDAWGDFPDASQSFYRVWMRLTLGCPGTGCSDWDYTTQVYLRHRTGEMDSNLVNYPSFTVNGQTQDSLHIAWNPTYTYSWNSGTQQTDSVIQNALTLVLFSDPQDPALPTDTLTGYPAGYYKPLFDISGNIYDSVFISPDSSLYLQYQSVYVPFEVVENIEIGRIITPYANGFALGWKWTYNFDVTDYRLYLHDSVEIRVLYSGYQDGFTVKLDFDFVEGIPPHEVTSVQTLYNGSFPYGDVNNSIENYLTNTAVTTPANAAYSKFRYWITGHGFGGNEDCAEFCPKNYYLQVNGAQVGTNLVWNDQCGMNPIAAQPGTWIYDRANWCPGSRVYPFDHNIAGQVTPGTTDSINVNMQPFTNVGNNFCSYTITGQYFTYTAATRANDVEVEEILNPNKDKRFNRSNPVCDRAKLVIRNAGSNAVTSVEIQYGVEGGVPQTYTWTGNIPFLGTDTVELPVMTDWAGSGTKIFEAEITGVNGGADSYGINNQKSVSFDIPPLYPDTFLVVYKTNLYPGENSYTIKDINGNTLYQRSGFASNTIYKDTVLFTPGCYIFEWKDSDKDGITWWANNDGSGYVRFQKAVSGTQIIRNFSQDYGTRIYQQFTIGGFLSNPETETGEMQLYPNPTSGLVYITLPGIGDVQWKLLDISGRQVQQGNFQGNYAELNFPELVSGIYILQAEQKGKIYTQKLIKN